ncbi:DUF2182 domain-containing protein [Candidatus Bathyarchaeota archaeon]|nr:MAG: DUF2182 domain-containing protein [Candidatus Bathyarchaeota archaeon]
MDLTLSRFTGNIPGTAFALAGSLGVLSLVSWYFVAGANMPIAGTLDAAAFVLFTAIWGIGMVAMMFPSLIPMIYVVTTSTKKEQQEEGQRSSAFQRFLVPFRASLIVIATGLYQFTRFKQKALMKCRSPMSFILTCWKSGSAGAGLMGADYGFFCTKCCWVLMVGLLIVGTMSLPLMGTFTLIIFAEKVVPRGHLMSRLIGAAFLAAGFYMLI